MTSHSARSRCPIHRSRTSPVPSTPGVASRTCPARVTRAGSTASISRRYTSRPACHSTAAIATVIPRPVTGSAQPQPIAAPPAPSRTASEVNPSARACSPSATSAADPIRRPALIRYRATSSLPANPATAAAATAASAETGRGCTSRVTASQPASTEDAAIITTTATPARSSARPYP